MTSGSVQATELLQALVGRSFPMLCVGVGDLQMHFDGDVGLQLCGPVQVSSTELVEPYSLDGLACLLPLLNNAVTAARAEENGALFLALGTTSLVCLADDAYEPWSYTGPDDAKVVSLPGGDYAIWNLA